MAAGGVPFSTLSAPHEFLAPYSSTAPGCRRGSGRLWRVGSAVLARRLCCAHGAANGWSGGDPLSDRAGHAVAPGGGGPRLPDWHTVLRHPTHCTRPDALVDRFARRSAGRG